MRGRGCDTFLSRPGHRDSRRNHGERMSAYSGIDNLEAMSEAVNYRHFLAGLIATSAPRGVPHARVLDFGAGIGTYAVEARGLGFDVLCVELDSTLQVCLTDLDFEAHSSLDELPSASCSYGYTFNVLEHIEDDEAALRDLRRVIAPGGALLIYVPAFPLLFSGMDRKVGHCRRYRRLDLDNKVRRAGFVVESSAYADSLGFIASLLYRLLSKRSNGGALSPRSVRTYDKLVFPISRQIDRLTSRWFGKNLIIRCYRPQAG
jgi:SAM-dependent methyltransferase